MHDFNSKIKQLKLCLSYKNLLLNKLEIFLSMDDFNTYVKK